ncbi:T9SS type A sorting domain-containing protein [Aureisphaera galaxeae]|uniref:T9SS type A sorting domain-containing protein n=1 Tax=Aureisphaera galaxeae TaxID=1538023 RepID=UPI0023506E21|nr:T9SS type A sorting domain-containing protein [Aureisphaera galaxeae]MDC8006082.1 T9SS type A sorting domain-containing protein [Aureisphaera galaxeae]
MKRKLLKFLVGCLCFFVYTTAFAQPDTTVNRYATTEDADYWSSVNEGDYIFFTGTINDGQDIYVNGTNQSINLPLGKKILIWRGEYRRIYINGQDCASTAEQPTIITNLGGQVKWGYSEAQNHYRSLELYNFDHLFVTGKYDPANQTGDENFVGHNDGLNYNDPNFHEKYGLWGHPRWSGYRFNGTFSNIVRIRHFQTCKISYVAASEGGFAGFNIKTDNPSSPQEVEVDIQDCFTAMTESEGFYVSYSTAAEGQDITKLTLRNNIMAFNGSEAMQTDNLVEGSVIEHNVAFAGSCFFRRPFQDNYQDGLHQFSFCEGGISVNNNAMITGNYFHKIRYLYPGPGRVDPSESKVVTMENNYYGFSRSNISYVWQGDGITPYVINDNMYGPVSTPTTRDAYVTSSEWDSYFRICNNNTDITITNCTYPGDRPLYEEYCGDALITDSANVTGTAPTLAFVNSGFDDATDYRKFTFWSAEYGTAEKAGIFIPYEVGDYVFYYDNDGYTRFYQCIQDHAGDYDPNLHPEYWQLLEWDGQRLPPLDLRMRNGSYYDQRDIGLMYEDVLQVEEFTAADVNIALYPNPTRNFVEIDSEQAIAKMEIIGVSGVSVFTTDRVIENTPIRLPHLAQGLYMVRMYLDNGIYVTKKLLIE